MQMLRTPDSDARAGGQLLPCHVVQPEHLLSVVQAVVQPPLEGPVLEDSSLNAGA